MILRTAEYFRNCERTDEEPNSGEAFRHFGPAFIPGMMKGEEWPRKEGENRNKMREAPHKPVLLKRLQEFYIV
jgi:hypothetical protein